MSSRQNTVQISDNECDMSAGEGDERALLCVLAVLPSAGQTEFVFCVCVELYVLYEVLQTAQISATHTYMCL